MARSEPVRAATVRAATVRAELDRLLAERTHLGFRNWIGDRLLEPRNPFEASRRRPKRWVAATLGLTALAALNLYYFHLR